jgi:hypothetical protein
MTTTYTPHQHILNSVQLMGQPRLLGLAAAPAATNWLGIAAVVLAAAGVGFLSMRYVVAGR